jgi:hypothetical protein
LFRVRGAVLLRDGSIAVANNGTHEARVYGLDGKLLRRIGREGDGPGELSSLEAGTHHVLLLLRDELDVERVALVRLVRTAQPESSRPDR